jgi:catechol 2,3-dioxygenase-like lactoylglutathione lyase family enzyme
LIIVDPPAPAMPTGFEQGARLRAVVLGSRAPRRAAAWYRRALGLSGADEVLEAGDVELRITSRADVAPAAVEPIRAVLNFVVDDIRAVEARLMAMEAIWVRELERAPWGIIGTVVDLDGNLVQIIEPARETSPWLAKGREEHT